MIPPPHGGRLIDGQVSGPARDRLEAELPSLPRVRPSVDQIFDAEKIALGAYSPLDGFMGTADLETVLAQGRLPSGLPWPMPVIFPVPEAGTATRVAPPSVGDEVVLEDPRGTAIAVLRIDERFRIDRGALARAAYGTDDPAHPNVADILHYGEYAWAGPVRLLRRLERVGNRPEPGPAEMREEFGRLGWRTVAAYQCRNPPHTAHEYLQRVTLEREEVDGLLVHPVVGRLKKGDYRPEVILDAYDALVRAYYPPSRVIVRPLGITMRYGGPKAALFLAIVRKNYGCGEYIVGRDQAGVGNYYDPYACHRIFDAYDIGIVPLRYEESFFCRRCGWMASDKVCPHGSAERVTTSQTRVRESLARGETLPTEILRPEVAEVLRRPGAVLTS